MENTVQSFVAQKARILNAEDVITEDVYTIVEGPDRKGNFLLVNDATQKRARAHPTRILKLNPEGSPVFRQDTEMRAKCPKCDTTVVAEIAQEEIVCPEHGTFPLDWSKIDAGVRPAVPEPEKKTTGIVKAAKKAKAASGEKTQRRAKAPIQIDFDAMRAAGEIWTKAGVEFDYPGFDVKAHILLIEAGADSRKLCFNSYNGTWGKKSKDEDLQLFLTNQRGPGNKVIGYFVKGTLDQERRKLEKSGYVKENK